MKVRYCMAAIFAMGFGLGAAPNGIAMPTPAGKSVPATLRPALYRALAHDAGPAYRVGANGCAVLPRQALRGCFRSSGSKFDIAGHARVALHLAAYGRGTHLSRLPAVEPRTLGDEVRYEHGSLTEWWRMLPQGFEQGFTLKHRPAGHGEVTLVLKSSQPPRAIGGKLAFGRLRYGTLVVTDAEGRVLPATLTSVNKHIHIAVNDVGARYPLTVDPLVWVEQKFTANDGAANDAFGSSVSIDNQEVLVGAPDASVNGNGSQGAVYVFTRSNGVWTLAQKLTASDGAAGDGFGSAVLVGLTGVLIGAPNAAVNGHAGQGAVYVYINSGGTLSFEQKLTANDGAAFDGFGHALAATPGTVLVGAPNATISSASQQGAVYVFAAANGTWSQSQKLVSSDGALDDHFGDSVAVYGADALVGAPNAAVSGSRQGAVYVFNDSNSVWGQTQKLTASDGASGDNFGGAVGVSNAGALVGAPQAKVNGYSLQGAVYAYTSSGGIWSQAQKLTAGDNNPYDFFGSSISAELDAALIGAYGTAVNGQTYQGAVYRYSHAGGTWVLEHTFTASDASGIAHFGSAVALHQTDSVIGAPIATVGSNSGQGAVYDYGEDNLSLTVSAPQVAPSSSTYVSQAIVTNNGVYVSPAIAVTVAVPAAASFVSANATQGSCSQANAVVTCDLGGVNGTATANVILRVQAPAGATIVNTARVSRAMPELTASAPTVVSSANNPPVATNGSVTTNKNTAVSGRLSASDADSDTLTLSIVAQPSHGTVNITDTVTGAFTYTPVQGYAGNDSFTFKANDSQADSNVATESVTVLDRAPIADNGSVSAKENTAVSANLSASDPDNDTLAYSVVKGPLHGAVAITNPATGAFTYTPASGFSGGDSFTFKTNDGQLDSNTATETVTVKSSNTGGGSGGSLSTGGGGGLGGVALIFLVLLSAGAGLARARREPEAMAAFIRLHKVVMRRGKF